jgi:hypothetical protein
MFLFDSNMCYAMDGVMSMTSTSSRANIDRNGLKMEMRLRKSKENVECIASMIAALR